MARIFFSVAVLSMLSVLPLAAQNAISSGAIAGCVRDPSGKSCLGPPSP